MVAALGCASANSASAGSISIKSGANAAYRPVNFSVGGGHISGSQLDAYLDNGCIRGALADTPIQFCQESSQGGEQRWTGSSGDFKVRVEGNLVHVDGVFSTGTVRQYSMTQTLQLGEGPAWAEMRKNPALLAVAATAADLQAAHLRRR